MKSHFDLLQQFGSRKKYTVGEEPVQISLAAWPDRIDTLAEAVGSLLPQADSLHVFLNGFEQIPAFLDHDRIYLTHSQDFGDLGSCGKYYWCDDLTGFMVFCEDHYRYPADFVTTLRDKAEKSARKAVVAAGGILIREPYHDFSGSAEQMESSGKITAEMELPILSDDALAFYSDSFRLSRHYFYQPELSACWLSIAAKEQRVPLLLFAHEAGWLQKTGTPPRYSQTETQTVHYRDFLIRSWFSDAGGSSLRVGEINDMFDRIYVMNLDRRPDRWKNVRRQVQRHKIRTHRFPAVDGYREVVKRDWEQYFARPLQTVPAGIEPLHSFTEKFTRYHHYVARIQFMEEKFNRKAVQSPGAYGYALSYIAILEEAVRKSFHRILIFDDDILLHRDFRKAFSEGIPRLPADWYLIMLGAMQHNWDPWISWVNDTFYRCHGSSVASHAVGIDRKMFLPLLWYARRLDLPIDEGALFHIQNVYSEKCFVWYPNLAIQDTSESDISTSAMKSAETNRWLKLFRWDPELYKNTEATSLPQKLSIFVKYLKRKFL